MFVGPLFITMLPSYGNSMPFRCVPVPVTMKCKLKKLWKNSHITAAYLSTVWMSILEYGLRYQPYWIPKAKQQKRAHTRETTRKWKNQIKTRLQCKKQTVYLYTFLSACLISRLWESRKASRVEYENLGWSFCIYDQIGANCQNS